MLCFNGSNGSELELNGSTLEKRWAENLSMDRPSSRRVVDLDTPAGESWKIRSLKTGIGEKPQTPDQCGFGSDPFKRIRVPGRVWVVMWISCIVRAKLLRIHVESHMGAHVSDVGGPTWSQPTGWKPKLPAIYL